MINLVALESNRLDYIYVVPEQVIAIKKGVGTLTEVHLISGAIFLVTHNVEDTKMILMGRLNAK